jgi:hypothetical protein
MGRTQQKILAALSILLVGAVVLLTSTPDNSDTNPTAVVVIDPLAVVSMKIDTAEGQLNAVRSTDGIWTIEAPFEALGSQTRFDGVIEGLNGLVTMEPLESTEYAQFGLLDTNTTVEIVLLGGQVTTILFGDNTPVGDNRYLRVNDGMVLVGLGDINQNIERPFATYPADAAD